jgi:hypothetical protein
LTIELWSENLTNRQQERTLSRESRNENLKREHCRERGFAKRKLSRVLEKKFFVRLKYILIT